MQVQTRLENDVAMAKRRHENHADTQFVFIPQAKPDTPWRTSVVPPYVSPSQPSMTSLARQHNEKSGTLITPIRLTFGEEVDTNKGKDKEKGVVEVDDDLKKPYKEVLESPFTRRIIEFSAPSHRMPTNLRVLPKTLIRLLSVGTFPPETLSWTKQDEENSGCLATTHAIEVPTTRGIATLSSKGMQSSIASDRR
ncbi:hypothetical protein Tco_1242269 [Tanacetum coccineum]